MTTNEKNKKMCTIYTSDFHLEMIILPYISRKLNENENIVIMNEKNLEDSAKIIINKMQLKEGLKKNLKNINLKNNDFEKFKEIKEKIKEDKKLTIFIQGKENYIENVNNNLEKWIKNSNVDIIDCYELSKDSTNLQEKIKKYEVMLNTLGISGIYK